MNIQEVVRRYRLEATSTGTDDVIQKTRTMSKSQDELGAASERSTQKLSAYDTAMQRHARSMELYNKQQQQMAAIQAQNAMMVQQNTAALMTANDNYAKSNFSAASAVRSATSAAIDQGTSYLATAGKIGAGIIVFGGLLGVLGTLYLAYKILKTGIDLVTDSWELGGQKLAEYRKIAEGAAAVDLSTQYFQRITKAATDTKLPIDDLTASFKKLAEVSAPKLGGSDFNNRLDASVKAGNFSGNTGVGQLAAANTTEEKFRAIVSLTDQAFKKGEALAALDLTSKFLSPAAQAALTKDNEFLHNMQAAADKIASTALVSDADVGRALAMQNKWDAAVAILETRWHPLQGLMTSAGIAMQETWINIVSAIASAVDWATRLVTKLTEVKLPPSVVSWLNRGAMSDVENAMPDSTRGVEKVSSADLAAIAAANARGDAVARLTAGLQNQKAVEQAAAQVNAVQSAVWKDTSHAIDTATKAVLDHKDALARAMDTVEKYILTTNAAAKSVDATIFEQEKAKVIAQLTAAAQRDGKTNLDQYAAAWDETGNRAGTAAQKFKLAQVQSAIKFDSQTMFLSSEDVKIATQLNGLLPDIATSLASPEAAAMRFNDRLRETKDISREFAQTFVSGLLQGKDAMAAMPTATKGLAKLLAAKTEKEKPQEAAPLLKKAA